MEKKVFEYLLHEGEVIFVNFNDKRLNEFSFRSDLIKRDIARRLMNEIPVSDAEREDLKKIESEQEGMKIAHQLPLTRHFYDFLSKRGTQGIHLSTDISHVEKTNSILLMARCERAIEYLRSARLEFPSYRFSYSESHIHDKRMDLVRIINL